MRPFRTVDTRFLAMIAAVALALLFAALLFKLKDRLMKHRLAAACLLAGALALAGCAGSPFIRVNPELSPAIQEKQADTAQGFYKSLGDRLQYCTIIGNIDLNLKASTEAGLQNTAGLNCPARPWDQAPQAVPLSEIDRVVDAAVARALDAYTAPSK